MQNFQTTELNNGLTIITDAIDTVESATVGIWCKTGSRFETPQQLGVAHFFEHMVFKGTKTKSALDIAEMIENVGGDMNAYTSREMTSFHARILSEHLPVALNLISDILINPSFPEQEIERERQVILQEIGMYYDTPDDHVFSLFQEGLFPNSPLGHSILGTKESVSSFQFDDIHGFMMSHYTPENMALCCSGKVDHKALVEQAEKLFSNVPRKDNSAMVLEKPASLKKAEHIFEDRASLEQTHVMIGFQGLGYTETKDYAALKMVANILGGGMSSRLFQEIREKRGLAYAVYGFAQGYYDSGSVGFYAGTDPKRVEELVPAMFEQITGFAKSIKDTEIDRVRAQMKARALMSLESTYNRCDRLGRGFAQYGTPRPISQLIEEIDTLTKDDLIRVADAVFNSPPIIVGIGRQKDSPNFNKLIG